MRYCPQCGSSAEDGDRFCCDCALPLAGEQAVRRMTRRLESVEWTLVLGALLLVVLAAVVLVAGLTSEGMQCPCPAVRWSEARRQFAFGFAPHGSDRPVAG